MSPNWLFSYIQIITAKKIQRKAKTVKKYKKHIGSVWKKILILLRDIVQYERYEIKRYMFIEKQNKYYKYTGSSVILNIMYTINELLF